MRKSSFLPFKIVTELTKEITGPGVSPYISVENNELMSEKEVSYI